MTTPFNHSSAAPRAFQFRLLTLLIATTWIGLLCMAVRSPADLWTGGTLAVSQLAILFSALLAIYRRGQARASALGFLIFGGAYMVLNFTAEVLAQPSQWDDWLPSQLMFDWLYARFHPGIASIQHDKDGTIAFTGTTVVQVPYEYFRLRAIYSSAMVIVMGCSGGIAARLLHATQVAKATTERPQAL